MSTSATKQTDGMTCVHIARHRIGKESVPDAAARNSAENSEAVRTNAEAGFAGPVLFHQGDEAIFG
jgi:hypothetical protein